MDLYTQKIEKANVPGIEFPVDVVFNAAAINFHREADGQMTGSCSFTLCLPGDGEFKVGDGVASVPCTPDFEAMLKQALMQNVREQLGVK